MTLMNSAIPFPRIIVGGGPRTGKTTLATKLASEHGLALLSSDSLISLGWSEASTELAGLFDRVETPWIAEGVATVRAIRKHLASHPEGLPADRFVWLTIPKVPQTAGQRAMAKGCQTVWNEILPELLRRGAQIFTDTDGGPLEILSDVSIAV